MGGVAVAFEDFRNRSGRGKTNRSGGGHQR